MKYYYAVMTCVFVALAVIPPYELLNVGLAGFAIASALQCWQESREGTTATEGDSGDG